MRAGGVAFVSKSLHQRAACGWASDALNHRAAPREFALVERLVAAPKEVDFGNDREVESIRGAGVQDRVTQHVRVHFENRHPRRSRRALIRPAGSEITKSMSLVARGSPWRELAKLPPTKYSAPTEVSAVATLTAMSIAFSPTSADILPNAR
jgi:hypothetical protein